jgi:putative transposase
MEHGSSSIQAHLGNRAQKSWPSFLRGRKKTGMELHLPPGLRRPHRPASAGHPLRDRLAAHVASATLSLLDPDRIEALGEDMRIIELHRVHHAGLVVSALVLSAFEQGSDTEGRWLDAQQVYVELGGPVSGATSFRNMGRKMLPVMQTMLRRRVEELIQETKNEVLKGRLAAFRDVLIPDGCAFKLASILSGISPGTGQPAELKLHAVYSLRAKTAITVIPTAGSVHDSDGFWPERWQAGALYIYDLGYQSNDRFVEASLAGAHLLQRLKENVNPVVVASYGPTGYRRVLRHDDGSPMRLKEACTFGHVHQQDVLDLDVEVTDGKGRTVIARIVCVPVDEKDHYFLSTLPRDAFSPFDLAELYRVRWEVELFFRNWKGGVRMDHVHRLRNPTSLAVAVMASMLAALLSRDIATGLERLQEEYLALPPAPAPERTTPPPRSIPPSGVDVARAARAPSLRTASRST